METRVASVAVARTLRVLLSIGWLGRFLALLSFDGLVLRLLLGKGVIDAATTMTMDWAAALRLGGISVFDADMMGRIEMIRSAAIGDMALSVLDGRFFWIDNLMAAGAAMALRLGSLTVASVFGCWWSPTLTSVALSVVAFLILSASAVFMVILNVAARRSFFSEGPVVPDGSSDGSSDSC